MGIVQHPGKNVMLRLIVRKRIGPVDVSAKPQLRVSQG